MLKKGFKEVLLITNREFTQEVKGRLPLAGTILVLTFCVIALVYSFTYNFGLGILSTPFIILAGIWGVLFTNNLYISWK